MRDSLPCATACHAQDVVVEKKQKRGFDTQTKQSLILTGCLHEVR